MQIRDEPLPTAEADDVPIPNPSARIGDDRGKPHSTFKPNQYSILSAYNARSLQSLWKCEELALTCKNYKIRICGIQEQKILIKYSDGIEYQKAGKGLLVLGRSYLNANNSPHGEIGAFLNERSLKTSRQPSCSGQAI